MDGTCWKRFNPHLIDIQFLVSEVVDMNVFTDSDAGNGKANYVAIAINRLTFCDGANGDLMAGRDSSARDDFLAADLKRLASRDGNASRTDVAFDTCSSGAPSALRTPPWRIEP